MKKQEQIKMVRVFTKGLNNVLTDGVYCMFNWKKVDVKIENYKTKEVIYSAKDLEFPENFSLTACQTIASKYFRNNDVVKETSFKQLCHRMVMFWQLSLIDSGLLSQEEAEIFYDEMAYAICSQMIAPNSPQFFNTGLEHSYGYVKKAKNCYYYDPEQSTVAEATNAYTRTSASACYILGIEDSLLGPNSITDRIVTETALFRQGAGSGINFSNLRGKGEQLSGGWTSSGVVSFLKAFDSNAGAIKSGGTTRRAAKIVSLDINHPDIEEFIKFKQLEERKVRDLAKMGYSVEFDGEAYSTVSGQNANNSVRLNDYFMKSLDKDEDFDLIGRVNNSPVKTVKAKHLWDLLNEASWECADPGIQYDDNTNDWHTCPFGLDGSYNAKHNRINASNPCAEFVFLDNTACNLASINLLKFFHASLGFNLKGYLQVVTLGQLMLEASIHWGQFPTKEIAFNSYMFRPTGLGIANLASVFMYFGIGYDSEEARELAKALMSLLTARSYNVSSWMAERIGTFQAYELNKKAFMDVMSKHAKAVGVTGKEPILETEVFSSLISNDTMHSINLPDLFDTLDKEWTDVLSKEEVGFRNAQVSVIAPTGTISLAMDCDSTSLEPFFAHVTYKKLMDGSYMSIVNRNLPIALHKLGYSSDEITHIVDYILEKDQYGQVIDGKIEGAPHLKEEHYSVFDTANTCGTGKRAISPMGHVRMVAALTPCVSGAISKTVNLPYEATVEDFKDVHYNAWKMGIKGIALYRNFSKACQPLNSNKQSSEKKLEDMTYTELIELNKQLQKEAEELVKLKRIKPNGIRYSRTHSAVIQDLKIYVNLTFDSQGDIREIYIDTDREGTLIKGTLDSLSKMISKMLQYGIPATEISRSLKGQKYEPHGLVFGHPYIKMTDSISDFISKIIELENGDFSSCQQKPEPNEFITYKELIDRINMVSSTPKIQNISSETHTVAKKEYDRKDIVHGKTCSTCQSTRMVKNGTCYLCLDCGSTTGCS